MKKDDIILLVLALGLLLAMVITFLLGGARSRHGYGGVFSPAGQSVVRVSKEQGRLWAVATPAPPGMRLLVGEARAFRPQG